MKSNNKYFTADEIYVRILSSFPKKGAEVSKLAILRWCSELITDYLRDPVGLLFKQKVQIGNGPTLAVVGNKVPVPSNIFKLQSIFNQNYKLIRDYQYNGAYIFFGSEDVPEKVFIDYYSLALDELGFPLIKRGYESAAQAYCIYKMFEEDAGTIPPRIPQWRWMQICQEKEYEIQAAMCSWDDITDNDIKEIHNYLLSDSYALFLNKMRPNIVHDKNNLNLNSQTE